ncbi:hypothetical protein SBRCBS47491_005689 [Sporothrix bragantina]|uniref:BHLH domain-containing protein n=1 Tax=Sporothrix bragantina TaxID=671064 RepID=A0ABP0BYQ4_9PEZI
MPRTTFPPTPASSTDIQGQDGSKQLANLHMAFELPPPALVSTAGSGGSGGEKGSSATTPTTALNTDINMLSPPIEPNIKPPTNSTKRPSSSSPSSKTAYPVQAAETVKSRRRSSALQAQAQVQAQLQAQAQTQSQPTTQGSPSTSTGKDAFALPPPPTRSRKIIQMKPRTAANSGSTKGNAKDTKDNTDGSAPATAAAPAPPASTKTGKGNAAAAAAAAAATVSSVEDAAATETAAPAAANSKKKQPSATSAAGRKIARKTAHSLIERRRRSKMNEEFAVLKGMIPACTGEMHKLAILQASIEYVRYLEDCVATLRAQRESEQQQRNSNYTSASPGTGSHQYLSAPFSGDAESPDVEMTGTGGPDDDDKTARRRARDDDDDEDDDEEEDEDDEDDKEDDDFGEEEMSSAHNNTGSSRRHPRRRHASSASPALLAQDQAAYHHQQKHQQETRHNSQSSTASSRYSPSLAAAVSASLAASASGSADHRHRHYGSFSYPSGGFTTSAQTSPAFGPQQQPLPALPLSAAASPFLYGASGGGMGLSSLGEPAASISGSTLTSPALLPQRDMDQEATAALLMLNSDRRGTSGSISGGSSGNGNGGTANGNAAGRGMSVQDLLST